MASPVTSVTTRAKTSARGSIPISSARGISSAPNATRPRSVQWASSTPSSAAEPGDDQALGDQLAHHVGSIGAEREARGDLLAPAGEARQQQVGDVGAGDQQHAADGAEQQQVALALIAHGIVEQRHYLDGRRRIDIGRVGLAIAGGDDVHGAAGLLERHTRL